MKFDNIIFSFPSRQTGGAQYLFIRYASELCKSDCSYNIMYIDYSDGFARKELKGEPVSFIDYEEGRITNIPPNSLVNFQLNKLPIFEEEIGYDKSCTAFMFWYLHVTNLRYHIYVRNMCFLFKREQREAGKDIEKLIDRGTIILLNVGDYIDFVKDFGVNVHEVNTIPLIVPTNNFHTPRNSSVPLPNPIRLCWLGRLDEEKSRNIITYMNELEGLNVHTKVSMSLIGTGPVMGVLKEISKRYSYPIEFVGEKRDTDLDNFIRNNVDIGLASGTSSLEFGLRGIPVIEQWVIPRIYKAGEIMNYTHAYDRPKIDITVTSHKKNMTEDSFENKFKEIVNDYPDKSRISYDFAMSFSPQNGCKKLLCAIRKLEQNFDNDLIETISHLARILNRPKRRRMILSMIKGGLTLRFLGKSNNINHF